MGTPASGGSLRRGSSTRPKPKPNPNPHPHPHPNPKPNPNPNQARQLDAAAAKRLVRSYLEASGAEWGSLQAQESAARALLLDPDYRAPETDSEETRDCEPAT